MLAKFSFFVTSLPALVALSGKPDGFGGDLRFGMADGLSGADEICRQVAERGLPGAGRKQWRAFLSATTGPGGTPVHARDRIGPGPWYDRKGRLVASDLTNLFGADRPAGGDAALSDDLPNETGDANRQGANHDTLTGSDPSGRLKMVFEDARDTCGDWTSTTALGFPAVGRSWSISPTALGSNWVSASVVHGCAAGVHPSLGGTGGGPNSVGHFGGYGGFYCFALP